MRRSVAFALALLASGAARADDPHDLFGVGGKHDGSTKEAEKCDEPHEFGCPWKSDPFDDTPIYALSQWLDADYLLRLPVADATQADVASYALGASRDDTGVSFGGATGLENRWTVNGAPIESLRTGAVDIRIPLTFLSGMTVTAGGFSAHDRVSTGGTIDAVLLDGTDDHEVNAHVWAGISGDSRRRPIAPGSFFLRRLTADARPQVTASVVATGPIASLWGGKAWYAAGIAPTIGSTLFTWTTTVPVDANGDGNPDGLPGQVITRLISVDTDRVTAAEVPFMARVGFDRGAHHLDLTLVGQAGFGTRFLANSTFQAAGVDRTDYAADGIATYRGTWKDTHALVQLAWHRSVHREDAHDDAAAGIPQLLSAYVPSTLVEEPQLAQLCKDGPTATITTCPVPFGYFASGGAGPLVDQVGDQPTVTAEVTHAYDAKTTLRAGGTLEDSRLIQTTRYTGGEQIRSLAEGVFDSTLRFFDGACNPVALSECNYASSSQLRFRSRYAAAYVEDTYQPQSDLRVDAGLRWELMWVGSHLHFSHELAPRGGISWDPLGGGRSRVWTSYARTYAMLPAGLGATVIRRDPTVTDSVTTLSPTNQAFRRDVDSGSPYAVVDGIEPMAQDEVTAGVEIGLAKTVRLTAWAQGVWLRRGLETTADGFDNPGRTDGLPARRSSELLAAEIATSPTGQLTLRAGYLVGKTIGNFLGPFDPRQGIILYNGDQFDGTGDALQTTGNEMGRLPTDVGHRLYVEAIRTGKVGPVALSFSTRLTLASGRPRNVLADTDIGIVQLVERGSAGRLPMASQANMRVGATWKGFEVTLDVFNVFDRGQGTSVDELFTTAFVRPIEGGSYSDLVFLKTPDGQDIGRRTAFGLPLTFQPPVSAVLGVHKEF